MKKNFTNWFNNHEVGLYVKQQEINFFNSYSKEINGNFAIQVGISTNNVLYDTNVKNYIIIGRDIICASDLLPFETGILSGICVIHELEFTANPKLFLTEIHRVLESGGKLILTALNPSSILLYLGIGNNKLIPKKKNIIHYVKLKEWLELLGFRIILVKFMAYIPIHISKNHLNKVKFLEHVGNRGLSYFSCVYGLLAIKNDYLVDFLSKEKITKNENFIYGQVLNPMKIHSNNIIDN